MERPNTQQTFMVMAFALAKRGTCPRRQVGCILVDKNNHILSTGYNGAPRGAPHCSEQPCPAHLMPSGEGLHMCEAIHAEQNALLQCKNVNEIVAAYTTTFPCMHCFKMLANTSCEDIFYYEDYLGHEKAVREFNEKLSRPLGIYKIANGLVHEASVLEPTNSFIPF